ncbi:MAG: GrpB family protein [Acidobacteria bacterium]|nr:GrpB family protein [Acidobacteriota bacterium]
METLEEKIARVVNEDETIVPYDPLRSERFEQERLHFRDYLTEHPDVANEYGNLKTKLSGARQNDRPAYTTAKSDFVRRVTAKARQYYGKTQ